MVKSVGSEQSLFDTTIQRIEEKNQEKN